MIFVDIPVDFPQLLHLIATSSTIFGQCFIYYTEDADETLKTFSTAEVTVSYRSLSILKYNP